VIMKGRVIDGPTGEPVTNARIFFRPVAYPDMYFFSQIDRNGQYSTQITADDVFYVEIKMDDKSIIKVDDFEIHATGGTTTTYLKDFYIGEMKQPELPVARTTPDVKQKAEVPKDVSTGSTRSVNTTKIEDLGKLNTSSDRAVVRNIYFDFNNTKVTDESLPVLNTLLKLMNDYPKLRIEIAGHTDSVGEEDVNQVISEMRANAIRNWLLEKGVAKDRMMAVGYGEKQPMATNDNE